MPRSLAAWVVALLPLAACPGPRAAPSCPPVAPTGPTAPLAPTDPTAAARAACVAGDLAGCDDLVEHWGQRELGPAAPADAEVLRVACDDRAIAAACMGHAVMRKYGTATGVRDPDGAAPYFARLVELGDIQGYRGKPPSAEGQAALAATERACATGRRRACAQLGWAAFSAVQRAGRDLGLSLGRARRVHLRRGQGPRGGGEAPRARPRHARRRGRAGRVPDRDRRGAARPRSLPRRLRARQPQRVLPPPPH